MDSVDYQAIFTALSEAMALHELIRDRNGRACNYRFLDVNPAYEVVMKVRRQEVIGKTVSEVFPQTDPAWMNTFAEVVESGNPVRFESYAGGLNRYFQVIAYRMAAEQFVTIFFDVTDRKRVELEAARLAAAIGVPAGGGDEERLAVQANSLQLAKQLQESQALYEISQTLASTVDLKVNLQQIADAAHSLIKSANRTVLHLLDESGAYLQPAAISGFDRPSAARRMNFKPGEGIAGIALELGQTINVSDVTTDPRYIAMPYQRQEQKAIRSLLVAPVKTGDKRLGTLSAHSPEPGVFSPDDERLLTTLGAQAAVAIERAKLYAELHASLEHEKATRAQLVQAEKLAALGRIVASVAHELNNPLQAIQNALYLVQMEEALSPQAREDMQTIINEADRMAVLIARLRQTYRPAVSEEFESESINTLVEEVHKLLGTHLRHNQVKFSFEPDHDLPNIPLIRDQIKQVILNICLNAVEAMPDGGQITVRTARQSETDGVVLSISDTGPSINPQILPYIFDPFVTTKDGGTGLGLAISYDIVRRHTGEIRVESTPGQGTVFHVWLPVVQRPVPDQEILQWG